MIKNRYLILAIFNLALFAVVGVIFFLPAVLSLHAGKANVRMLESRYLAERVTLAETEKIIIVGSLIEADGILAALTEISEMGEERGFESLEFSAVSSNLEYTDSIVEMRVRVKYSGEFYDLICYLQEFSGFGNMRSFSIYGNPFDIMDDARLRLEFSLFGSD